MIDRRLFFGVIGAFALAAVALADTHQAGRARAGGVIVPNTTCNSSSPCVTDTNTGTGAGLEGTAAKGNGLLGKSTSGAGTEGTSSKANGVLGITTFNSTSSSNGQAGVYGNDKSTSGSFDVGVHGNSVAGTGVFGTSIEGNGVNGASTNAIGVVGSSNQAAGVQGSSVVNDGADGITANQSTVSLTPRNGVFGQDASTDGGRLNTGVFGSSTTGIGLKGVSSWVGGDISGGYDDFIDNKYYPALSLVGDNAFDVLDVCQSGTDPCYSGLGRAPSVFEVDFGGNVHMAGVLYTAGSCSSGCARTRFGEKRVRFYTAQQSLPTVDDFGEGQLTAGEAHIAIDPAFANTMDKTARYMVFITPEGENNGLYVTGKTPAGFEVREVHGGRSTLSFAYRIVARPFQAPTARLQMITITRGQQKTR